MVKGFVLSLGDLTTYEICDHPAATSKTHLLFLLSGNQGNQTCWGHSRPDCLGCHSTRNPDEFDSFSTVAALDYMVRSALHRSGQPYTGPLLVLTTVHTARLPKYKRDDDYHSLPITVPMKNCSLHSSAASHSHALSSWHLPSDQLPHSWTMATNHYKWQPVAMT